MQQNAALAYQQTAQQTAAPRDLEASLLSRSAGRLQRLSDNWDEDRTDLADALEFNYKLWTVFMTSCAKDDNPLPEAIRQNIANLGMFVLNHTREIHAAPAAAKLGVLININREIAAGLRTQPEAAAQ